MLSIPHGLQDKGVTVPMSKLCQWLGVARRSTYYKATKGPAKVKSELAAPIKEMIGAKYRGTRPDSSQRTGSLSDPRSHSAPAMPDEATMDRLAQELGLPVACFNATSDVPAEFVSAFFPTPTRAPAGTAGAGENLRGIFRSLGKGN